jgi:hypothetical protein
MSFIPKLRDDFKSRSILDQEIEKKKVIAETEELIDEMGQENESKALSSVKKYVEQLEHEQREQFYKDFDNLKKASNNKQIYQRYLLVILRRNVLEESIPPRYSLFAESTDEGIVLGINKTDYVGAFSVSGIPEYDIRACKTLAVKLGNTIATLENSFTKTESGILLAQSKEQVEIVKREFDKKNG